MITGGNHPVIIGGLSLGLGLAVRTTAQAIEKTSTGFYYPTKTDPSQWDPNYASWLSDACAKDANGNYTGKSLHGNGGYGPDNAGRYHLGKDIPQAFGLPMYAIADGEVIADPIHHWDVNGDPAFAIVIQHHLNDGTPFIGIYGHINPLLKKGDKPKAGNQVGTIAIHTYPHGHLGIVTDLSQVTYPGYENCSKWPASSPTPSIEGLAGMTDPIEFIQTHAPLNVKSLPTGSLATVPGDKAPVYRVSKNNRLQHIDSPETFMQNGFDWARVMNVSGEFLTCYAKGGDITKTAGIENPNPWFRKDASGVPFEQYNEAKLLRFTGSDNVYIVADGKLHWLHISEKEFYSLGYHAQWIEDIMGNPPTSSDIGDEWGIERFTKCPNVPLAGLGGELTMSARTPLPYGHYDVDPFVIPYRLNDTNNVSFFSSK